MSRAPGKGNPDKPVRPAAGGVKPAGPPKPRPVTAKYLRNSAMQYIASRAASTAMLRQTLERRAKRRLCVRSLEPGTIADIEAVIGSLVTLGLVDDARFAAGRAATLANKGLPRRRVAEGLRLKGVAPETIERAIEPDFDDAAQARRFVERKRLGPFRRGGMTAETREKDLRALARAGFSFQVAKRALDQSGEG